MSELLTAKHLDFLRHSLGLRDDGGGSSYRNYFVAGGDDERVCRELVSMGLMEEGRKSAMLCGPLFHVTEEGHRRARRSPEDRGEG